ncbi:MAG: prephenate dehydrogenase/arogenate dehydrogenase family protein [Elusimicrobia bacterium]|nr:prephenate dehydrogenase/arogenate dehydrogenase family protein [Elusimicrobiota bacterium]
MKKLAIIGVGLIGGSLGMALIKSRKYRVIGVGRHKEKLILAKKLNAVDEFTTDFSKGVSSADVVIVCTPVDIIDKTIKNILPYLKKGAIVSDVGSVKGKVLEKVKTVLKNKIAKRNNICFIGAHPMAGSEKTGVRFASENLFKDATVVLVKEKLTNQDAFAQIKNIWQLTGARIKMFDVKSHDKSVALISHLPHLIAFNLCNMVKKLKQAKDISSLLAGSFKDITRVADSNPRDWAAICNMNKEELKKAINIFIKYLNETKKKLGDIKALEKIYSDAKSARLKLLQTGA